MPINKNAYIRYQALDACFSNRKRRFFYDDLLKAVNEKLSAFNGEESGIGRTQFFKDLRFMESDEGFSAEIEKHKEGKKTWYRYKDPNFSIQNAPVNNSELNAIHEVISVFKRFKGLPQFDWLEELLPGLEDRLKTQSENPSKQVIYFDDNLDYTGREYIEQLYHHIVQQEVLDIEYQDFKAETSYIVTLHPYILKQYNQRWFLFGRNEENGVESWNLALDRIKSITVNRDIAYKATQLDWEEDYFYDMIGVTRYPDAVLEQITLYCPNQAANYMETKPLHPSQRIVQRNDNGSIHLEITLYRNPEFESKLRQFEGVEILSAEPKS